MLEVVNDQFKQENDILFNSLLKRLFFDLWKKPINERNEYEKCYDSIEFILTNKCNLNCKYCYLTNNNQEKTYPSESINPENILKNVELLCDWIIENDFYISDLSLFSGEIWHLPLGLKVLDIIYEKLKKKDFCNFITMPTNGTFILNNDTKKEMEDRILKFGNELNKRIFLSFSLDGLYADKYRINNEGYVRTQEDYDKIFDFAGKHKYCFHPMLYSEAVDKWKNNFLWFQDMFKKHNIPWFGLYLLEVRNSNWTLDQCKQLKDLMSFLVDWSWKMLDGNYDAYMKSFYKEKMFNCLSSPFIFSGRGVGCGIQSSLYIRVGDLYIVPCHRLTYDFLNYGNMIVKDNKISEIVSNNVEFAISMHGLDHKTLPYCESCIIKNICFGGCFGANYENTKDPFTIDPRVCRMEMFKFKGILEGYLKIGILDELLKPIERQDINKYHQLKTLIYKGDK